MAIALAEFGDKTQISILLLSTRTRFHLSLLLGVMVAFLLVDGIAVLLGSWITTMVPVSIIKIASGIVFGIFGIFILRDSSHEEGSIEPSPVNNAFLSGFTVVALTEWGDKTQMAAALFATQYDPLLVLLGTISALSILSVMAIYLGRSILARLDRSLIGKIAGWIFIVMGLWLLLS